jgi:NAD(P)-dependent dehydrogenase (short-subunit alcohol dehydrogenase family)
MSALKGKVVIVTGASTSKGIGSAIARRFAQEGAALYLVAEGTRERLEAVRDECRGYPECTGAQCALFDLGECGAAESMVADAQKRMGRIDILVNNAGIRESHKFGEYTRDVFERVVAVNLAAPFFAAQALVPIMRAQGGGRIINIASQLGHVTYSKRALYGLTKAALIHLTKSMAYELAGDGIIVNSISPGPIRTQFIIDRAAEEPEEAAQRLKTYLPAGRLGEPEEIAELALFLATTPATYLQGEDICIDGGYTSH